MKKFATGSLLLALALGLVSCDQKMGHEKKKEPYHPRKGMLTQQAEQKQNTPEVSSVDQNVGQ
ncbi:MAG: hypothetical protein P0S94_02005 [Simkaniaceae bacterium]|nr:hypothetical protein [Simkaniaceae bacterium]